MDEFSGHCSGLLFMVKRICCNNAVIEDDSTLMPPGKLRLLFIIISSGLFILLVFFSLFFLYRAPVLGIETTWNDKENLWQVASADPGSLLRRNDRLLEIGDVRLGFHHLLTDNIYVYHRADIFAWFKDKQAIYAQLSKPRVHVVLVRDGHTMQIEAPVHGARFSFLHHLESLHLLVGLAFFLIGSIVFWKKGFEEVGLVFFLMCMAFTLSFVTNAASLMSEIVYEPFWFALVNVLNIPNPMAIAAFLLHFSLLMPEKRRFLIRLRWLPWLFYAVCAIIELTLFIEAMNLVFPILFIGVLVALGQGFISYKNPIQRQQTKWVISGFGLSLLPFLLLNGIPLIITGQRLVSDTMPGIFFLLIPLSMAFAIQRYHLMDIDSLFDNTIIYTATFGALTVMDIGVLSLFSRISPESYRVYGSLATVLSIWLAIIFYAPVRNWFKLLVKRLLKRELYDLNEVSLNLSSRLISAADIPSVFETTMGIIDETLHPRGGCPYLFSEGGIVPVTSFACEDLPPGWADKARKLTSSRHLYEILKTEELPLEHSAGIIVPLSSPTGVSGCIVLRNKHSGRMYSRNDLRLLDMAARQATLAMESIRSREAMQRKEQETQSMKEHISREMHDGIGSSFTNAIMMLDLLSKEVAGAAGGSTRIKGLKDLLNEGLSDIRSLIGTMEEEGASLEDLAGLVKEKTGRILADKGIGHGVFLEIQRHDLPLSPLVIHHILRILQEAITNVLKHSEATEIKIRLREKEGQLSFSITDNGKGFDTALLDAGGYGLRNMKRRCDEIGADLRFSSSPGKGANITVLLPVSPPVV
jgi:signal transduction histidine kinase